jgi:UDP-N-acetylglucosamine 1-carboxyvinyltransferase
VQLDHATAAWTFFAPRCSRCVARAVEPIRSAPGAVHQPNAIKLLMAALQYVVEGGRTLSGTIRPSGNKNAALPIIAASLLAEEPVVLENVPRIRDVETLVELIRSASVSAEWKGRNCLHINARTVRSGELDPQLCRKIRASILLAAPMLARCGEVTLPPPGGDVIGRRRLDTHFLALQQLGTDFQLGEAYTLRAKRLKGADIFLDEPSVTGTENALTAAVAASGVTVLRNAASEPHVQDLARFLVAMGASIEGIGTNELTVEGGRPLRGTTHNIGPDHIEVGSFIGLAAVTNSELRIEKAGVEHLHSIRMGFSRLGIECETAGEDLVVAADQARKIQSDLGGHVPKLEDQPWPAFPADVMSIAIVTATQCEGVIMMHEKMFESRMFFVDKLIGMGARIVLCDPHRALVVGPSKLRAAQVESPDIRAGMAILLAALCATGESTIDNVGQIERGYERIDERLRALGAKIERVEERRQS